MAVDANGNPTNQIALDCNGNRLTRERFSIRSWPSKTTLGNPNGLCGVPIGGYMPAGMPANMFNGTNGSIDPLARANWRLCSPRPIPRVGRQAFLCDPKRTETENKFDIRCDYTISQKDNFFARFSYGNDSTFLPSPFNNVLDGGSFQDGYSENDAEGFAASEIHTFRNNLINEFRFGFNHLNSHRYNLNYNVERRAATTLSREFHYGPEIGGLPSHRLQRWHDRHRQLWISARHRKATQLRFYRQPELGAWTPFREVRHRTSLRAVHDIGAGLTLAAR